MGGVFIPMAARPTSELKFHHDIAPGVRYLAIDRTLCEVTPIYIAVRRVKNVKCDQVEYIDSHVHSVDSLYLFIGDEDELKGLHAVVRIEDQEREIESPMTVFIPKGLRHSYKITSGSGIYVSILLNGDYNCQTFEAK
jgi:2-isopropylmalate synthase